MISRFFSYYFLSESTGFGHIIPVANYFLYRYVFFYRYLVENAWEIGLVIFIVAWVSCIWKFKISGQKTACAGFILFIIMVIFNLFNLDNIAGLIAQYVFLLFVISFIQEFYHFLKYENK